MTTSGKAPPKFKKKMWTEEEDATLVSLVDKYGTVNWVVIAQNMPNRTGKQCRERYLNKFKEGIKNSQWTAEEDQLILEKQAEMGNSWVKIAEYIPGRSPDAIKTRHSWLKTKLENKNKQNQFLKQAPVQNSYTVTPLPPVPQPQIITMIPEPQFTPIHIEEPLPQTYVPEHTKEPPKVEEKVLFVDSVPVKSKENCFLPTIFEAFQTPKFPCSPGSTILNLSFLDPEPVNKKPESTDDYLFSNTDSVFSKRDPNCFWNKH